MLGVIIFFCGIGCGALGMCAAILLRAAAHDPTHVPRALPPATARQIARARRGNRADLRAAHDRRRWISPARADFDNEETL